MSDEQQQQQEKTGFDYLDNLSEENRELALKNAQQY
jgi:hypothetical protein